MHYFQDLLDNKTEKNESDDDEHEVLSHKNCLVGHTQIIEYLKSQVPPPYDPSQQTQHRFPSSSLSFDSYTPTNTVEVDAYLYSDDQIDQFVDDGLLSRWYCLDCKSRNVKYLNMISHSMGSEDLHALIQTINQYLGCEKKKSVLIDVGSRLGGVMWEAFFSLKHVDTIIGIEIEDKYVKLQRDVINKFGFNKKGQKKHIDIVHDDVLNQKDLFERFKERYIVLFHNVFEWFVNDDEAHQSAWRKMRQFLSRKGTIIVSCPPLKQSLKDAHMKNSDAFVDSWVKETFVMQLDEGDGENMDDSGAVAFYEVK